MRTEIFLIWCRSINWIIQHGRQGSKCIFIGQFSNLFFSETIMSMNLISSVNDVWMVLCEVSSFSADSKSKIIYHFINRWRYCWRYPISLEFGISIKFICIFNRCRQHVFLYFKRQTPFKIREKVVNRMNTYSSYSLSCVLNIKLETTVKRIFITYGSNVTTP